MRFFPAGVMVSVLLLSAGCTNPLATEKAAEEVRTDIGTVLVLEETTAGFDNPFTTEDITRATVSVWDAPQVQLAWERTEERETEASQQAREIALQSPVGSGIPVPEIQYEQITVSGSVSGDGLENGTRLHVPSAWEQGEYDLGGEGNGLLWLSEEQYNQLVTTRHATVTLGTTDTLLASVSAYYEQASQLVHRLRGDDAGSSTQIDTVSLTTLSANADWGSYTLMYNNEKVRVQTIIAENAFARFEILANAENPLVLSVLPRPASWVTVALETLHADAALAGYKVIQISPSSADQLQPQVQ